MTRRGKALGYVNYEKQERQCSICKEVKPFDEFPASQSKTPKSWCRLCHNKKLSGLYLARKLKEQPGVYAHCPKCGFIYHQIKHSLCPSCHVEENFSVLAGDKGYVNCLYCGKPKGINDFPAMAFVTGKLGCWECRSHINSRMLRGSKATVGPLLETPSTTRRKCLNFDRCGNTFDSKSKFNRICPECKETAPFVTHSLWCDVPELMYA